MKYTINMLSSAHRAKGHGVLSAYNEQVNLILENLKDKFIVYENKMKFANIMHYHTINLRFFLTQPLAKLKGKTVGYVHFVPDTIDKSLKLPKIIKPIFYRYIISFYKSMDYLIVVNPYFIDILSNYGVKKEKMIYIPNYVSKEKFYPFTAEKKYETRKKYKINKDDFVVLCVGQLQERKGIFDFIEIARKMPEIKFLWAGGFSFGSISKGHDKIVQAIKSKPDNIRFLGIVERSEMLNLYNISNVMFLPSFEELFPMAVLESMNCNIPILLRDIDIYKNILFDFYEKGSCIDEFIEIINNLKKDREYYDNAVKNSKKGSQFYHKEHVISIWENFYSNIIKK